MIPQEWSHRNVIRSMQNICLSLWSHIIRVFSCCPITSFGVFLVAASMIAFIPPGVTQAAAPTTTDRLVCLGDSITDGYTYGQIVIQSLREAGKPVPVVICAGRSSDTAPLMAARLKQTVLAFHPQLVTFSAGTNDVFREVSDQQYTKALREIVLQVQAQGGSLMLLTPCEILKYEGKTPEEQQANRKKIQQRLDSYEAIIRQVATEKACLVAETRLLMQKAIRSGEPIMTDDGIHPNYHGQEIIARAILNTMGYSDVALPRTFQPKLFPCVIPQWKMRLAPLDEKDNPQHLTAQTVPQLNPDASWKTYTLPDAPPANTPSAQEWTEQLRRNGFALQLQEQIGKGVIQAFANIESATDREAYLQVGIGASTVWLNGTKVHDQGEAWTGFHAGKERIAVKLHAGVNRLVVETGGPHFFVGISDDLIWEGDLR